MEAKIPEDKLMDIGFRLLDIMYGELTIIRGKIWDDLFVDKDDKLRLEYRAFGRIESPINVLGYQKDDHRFFSSYIPVNQGKFEEILMSWFKTKYNRPVNKTITIFFTINPQET